jgi:hypothetical protein
MFYTPVNNVAGLQLASPRSVGGLSLVLLPGQGARVAVWPTRVTVITAGTYGTLTESLTIFGVTAVNGDTLTLVGPLEGTVDNNYAAGDYADLRVTAGYITDINAALNGILGSQQTPIFTTFTIPGQSSVMEVGSSISAGPLSFAWTTSNDANVAANSITISDVTHGITLGTGLPNTGNATLTSAVITNVSPGVQTWSISGNDSSNNIFSSSYKVDWYWAIYYGCNDNPTVTSSDILALGDLVLQADGTGTFDFPAGGYKYQCIPVSSPQPTAFISSGFEVAMAGVSDDPAYSNVNPSGISYAIVSVTNSYGATTTYAVYRSQHILGGTFTWEVS